jgi:hypothetical protein
LIETTINLGEQEIELFPRDGRDRDIPAMNKTENPAEREIYTDKILVEGMVMEFTMSSDKRHCLA